MTPYHTRDFTLPSITVGHFAYFRFVRSSWAIDPNSFWKGIHDNNRVSALRIEKKETRTKSSQYREKNTSSSTHIRTLSVSANQTRRGHIGKRWAGALCTKSQSNQSKPTLSLNFVAVGYNYCGNECLGSELNSSSLCRYTQRTSERSSYLNNLTLKQEGKSHPHSFVRERKCERIAKIISLFKKEKKH